MGQFSDAHFRKFSRLIYNSFGIYMNMTKKDLLETKLSKIMRRNRIDSYRQYYDILTRGDNGKHLEELANVITVNQTSFFREINHFKFISGRMDFWMSKNNRVLNNKEIRVWSAACSTGEEAYTAAMVLKECMPPWINIRVLATDINKDVLVKAKKGIYPPEVKNDVETYYLGKYFIKSSQGYEVTSDIKSLVTIRSFNLMDRFPFTGLFDIILCRNVMIYFDPEVRRKLLNKFYRVMPPGGLIFIGHSESITAQDTQKFMYIQPTIYMKH